MDSTLTEQNGLDVGAANGRGGDQGGAGWEDGPEVGTAAAGGALGIGDEAGLVEALEGIEGGGVLAADGAADLLDGESGIAGLVK